MREVVGYDSGRETGRRGVSAALIADSRNCTVAGWKPRYDDLHYHDPQ
jgi:hypothetical protein